MEGACKHPSTIDQDTYGDEIEVVYRIGPTEGRANGPLPEQARSQEIGIDGWSRKTKA